MISPLEAMALFRKEVGQRKIEHRAQIVASRGLAALDALRTTIDPQGQAAKLWEMLEGDLAEHWIHPVDWFPRLSGRLAQKAMRCSGIRSLAFHVCACWWLDSFSSVLAIGWKARKYPTPVITPGDGAWRLASEATWAVDVVRQLQVYQPQRLARLPGSVDEVADWAATVAPMQLRVGWMTLGCCVGSGLLVERSTGGPPRSPSMGARRRIVVPSRPGDPVGETGSNTKFNYQP